MQYLFELGGEKVLAVHKQARGSLGCFFFVLFHQMLVLLGEAGCGALPPHPFQRKEACFTPRVAF